MRALRIASDPNDAPEQIRPSVTVASAAEAIQADPSTIRKLIKAKRLEGHRVGKRGIRVYEDSLAAYQRAAPLNAGAANDAAPRPARKPANSAAHREAVAFLAGLNLVSGR